MWICQPRWLDLATLNIWFDLARNYRVALKIMFLCQLDPKLRKKLKIWVKTMNLTTLVCKSGNHVSMTFFKMVPLQNTFKPCEMPAIWQPFCADLATLFCGTFQNASLCFIVLQNISVSITILFLCQLEPELYRKHLKYGENQQPANKSGNPGSWTRLKLPSFENVGSSMDSCTYGRATVW